MSIPTFILLNNIHRMFQPKIGTTYHCHSNKNKNLTIYSLGGYLVSECKNRFIYF